MEWIENKLLEIEPNRQKAGYLLYRIHAFFVVVLVASVVFLPKTRPIVLLGFLPFMYMHFRNMACPITKIERNLHKEDITVLDPVLMLIFGAHPTRQNRNMFQVIVSSLFVLLLLFLLI